MAAYAYTIPNDQINTTQWRPFSTDEKAVFAEMRSKAALDRKLANGE